MTAANTADGATARLAERLLGMRANREVIPPDPNHSVRWHQHSYPSPVARWNYHPEYEIHLIRKGTGKFIVGYHIGTFEEEIGQRQNRVDRDTELVAHIGEEV